MNGSSPVVLLVDDDRAVLEGLSCLLRRSPYDVLTAQSAAEGLAWFSRRRVDVVVSDEQMPGTSGSELLGIVAREHPETARILLTGRATLEAAISAINQGRVSRFLCKPCAPADFLQAVAEALDEAGLAAATRRLVRAARPAEPVSVARGAEEEPPRRTSSRFGALDRAVVDRLSSRQQEILAFVIDGARVSQIAKALFLSHHTVRNHLKGIFTTLGIHSQAELLERARGRG